MSIPWKKKCLQIILLVKGEIFLEKTPGALDYGCLPVYFLKFQKNSLKNDPVKLKLFSKNPWDSEIMFASWFVNNAHLSMSFI